MMRILELSDSEDDLLERVNLGDYNSDEFDEYLTDDMDTSPIVMTDIKTTISYDPPPAPPNVTVTVKLEDKEKETDLYERRRIRNQKRAFRRQRTADYGHKHHGDSFDYSNSDLHNIINTGRDARNIIISKRQEREETEAYCPSTNYHLPDDYSRPPSKRQHISSDRSSTSRDQHRDRATTPQERFNQILHQRCRWHPKGTHSTYECRTLLGAPMLSSHPHHE